MRRVPSKTPEYIAEMERAYCSLSVGCMLFMLGLAGVAIGLLILANYFNTTFGGMFDKITGQ